MPETKRVLVTDLDNTVWDWFAAWHGSFSAMLNELIRASGVPREVLENQIRDIHQHRGTTEYSNLLDEIPALIASVQDEPVWPHFISALELLRSERRALTKLYPGVRASLEAIKAAGFTIVAYTESNAYWTEWRIRHTQLDGIIDVLYSSPDHDLPMGMTVDDLRSRPDEHYGLRITEHRQVPRGVIKPNPAVLLDILDKQGFAPMDACYIGDSLMKDISMAQEAGVMDVHAKYGEVQRLPEYDLLRRVSHWTQEDVIREKALADGTPNIHPSYVCTERFEQILPILGLENLGD